MDIIERIKMIISHFNLNQTSFSKRIGVQQSNMSAILNKKRPCEDGIINKIIIAFPEINREWFIDGKGEMLNTPGFIEVPDEEVVNLNPKPFEKVTLVPLINIDSVGGLHHGNDITWREQYTVRHIPFIDARPDDVAIYQSGDSMTPGIPAGSILHLRQVKDWQEYFGYGDTFVLWLKDERRITKQVLKYRQDPKNYVTCHSFNPAYEDEELPKKFIRQVWKVITVLSDKGW